MRRAFTSAVHEVLSRTWVASAAPSSVVGHWGLAATSGLPAGRLCEGLVFVTSWKPCCSARRPEPWQLGQVVVSPNEFPIRRSPPQTPQVSSLRSGILKDYTNCAIGAGSVSPSARYMGV